MRGLSLLTLAIGCAAPAQGPAPAEPRAPLSEARPATATTRRAEPSKRLGNVSFHALPALTPAPRAPHLEIECPAFGDRIDPRLAERSEVAIRVLDAPANDATILVSLDGSRPRRLASDRKLNLGALAPDDRALGPGAHLLLATPVDAAGRALALESAGEPRPLALVGFSIGGDSPGGVASNLPSVFCLNPTGTLYLPPGGRVLFQALALGAAARTVPVRVRGPGVDSTSELDLRRAYEVVGLPFGDVTLGVGRAPGPYSECVVTINPEPSEGAGR